MSLSRLQVRRVWVTCFLLFVALVILFFSVNCASSGMTRTVQVSIVGAQIADLHSTHQAIVSGAGREGNPVMGSSWIRQTAIKVPVTVWALWAIKDLEDHGHPKAARLFGAAVATAIALVANHNYQLGRP